jgi:hypothetical protein
VGSNPTLSANHVALISRAIRCAAHPAPPAANEQEQIIRGILRAVHLDQDWLEVTVDSEHVRIIGVGDAVDDVIGPMVNHAVIVQVTRDTNGPAALSRH